MSTPIDGDDKESCETVHPTEIAPEPAPTPETYLQRLPIRYPWTEPVGSGRQSLLTRATATRIVHALQMGHSHASAAKLAGINPGTLAQWLFKGDTDEDTDATRDYVALRCAVMLAEASAEDLALRGVLAAGATDWKASAWWLSRRHHQTWAERSREGESGRSGVTINVGIALSPGESQPQAVDTTWASVPKLEG